MKHGNMKYSYIIVAVVFFLIVTNSQVFAETSSDTEGGIKTATELQLQISSLPEAKFVFNQNFIFPFLQGSGPLTKDNNIDLRLSAELSPLSLNGVAELNWTPVAFFVLSGGGRAGSGWNIPLGNGIGLNKPVGLYSPGNPREAEIDGTAFDGLLWAAWGAGTLQFDLGAVIPGDWTHVLFQTRHEFRYAGYTRAASGDPWVFENDEAENQNGWVYYANLVLGYQMPLSPVLETVAFMAELTTPLYATDDNFNRWTLSALFNFTFTPRFSTALIIQMRTQRSYNRTIMDTGNHYQDYTSSFGEGDNVLLFYRAAAILSYKIK